MRPGAFQPVQTAPIQDLVVILCKVTDNWDYFDELDGILSETNAFHLIELGKQNKIVLDLLPQLFMFCNCSTISDTVFSQIQSYPCEGIKRSIFISLSHCQISLYQLQYICSQKVCFEAFATLLDVYLLNDCFFVYDVVYLLNTNREYLRCINWDSIFDNQRYTFEKEAALKSYLN